MAKYKVTLHGGQSPTCVSVLGKTVKAEDGLFELTPAQAAKLGEQCKVTMPNADEVDPGRGEGPMTAEELMPLTAAKLKELATKLGLDFPGNISKTALVDLIVANQPDQAAPAAQ